MKELTPDDLLSALAVESFEKRHGEPPWGALKSKLRFAAWWHLGGGKRRHRDMVMYSEGFRDGYEAAVRILGLAIDEERGDER